MAITRIIDWRLRVEPQEAQSLLVAAFEKVALNPEVTPGVVVGHAKAKLTKNRWAADVTATLKPFREGSRVELRIDMPSGTKHYAVADEIAEQIPDDALDDRGLKSALERVNKWSKIAGWLEFRSVRHYLTATETVQAIGQGMWLKEHAIVVLTDERLFFFNKGIVGATTQEFALDAITSVVAKKGPTGETLIVTVASSAMSIHRMMHGQGEAIAHGFRELTTSEKWQPPMMSSTETARSGADELSKFASLHQQGVLTDEEFAAVKRQILGM